MIRLQTIQVEDFCSLHTIQDSPPPTLSPSRPLTSSPSASSRFLLLLSGLEFGGPLVEPMSAPPLELSAQLLTDFVSGRLGDSEASVTAASKIVRCVSAYICVRTTIAIHVHACMCVHIAIPRLRP